MLLLDRGGCFFAQKIYNAQRAGADVVLIGDNRDEPLLTMAEPSDHPDAERLVDNITIPASLITMQLASSIKAVLQGDSSSSDAAASVDGPPAVVAEIDWSDTIPDASAVVTWSLWGTSSTACVACERVAQFLLEFESTAAALTTAPNGIVFAPHFASWRCAGDAPECAAQCIYAGRYCVADPVDATRVRGADVAAMNLRHACAAAAAAERGWTALWWSFAAAFARECTVASGNYNHDCAEAILERLGFDGSALNAMDLCVGDTSADVDNALMEAEQALQADDSDTGAGSIFTMPTVVINDVQYRGRLDAPSVLAAICAGFVPGTEPRVCLTSGIEIDECDKEGAGGCWTGGNNLTACVDTFRGHKCVCPPGTYGNGYECDDVDECAQTVRDCTKRRRAAVVPLQRGVLTPPPVHRAAAAMRAAVHQHAGQLPVLLPSRLPPRGRRRVHSRRRAADRGIVAPQARRRGRVGGAGHCGCHAPRRRGVLQVAHARADGSRGASNDVHQLSTIGCLAF